MRIRHIDGEPGQGRRLAGMRALTLVEMMTTMGVFSLVLLALLYGQIFGLRQDELVESKLGASDQARREFGLIMRDIRTAQNVFVGNYSAGAFTAVANGSLQQGNAIQIYLNSANPNNIVYYFSQSSSNSSYSLTRLHTTDSSTTVLSTDLTNYYGGSPTFTGESFQGTPNYSQDYKQVIHFTLGFIQYQYPLTKIGANYLYDFYKMEFRVTPHVPPGR